MIPPDPAAIVTPLTYNEALSLAYNAIGEHYRHDAAGAPCEKCPCVRVAQYLIAVDQASREQAQAKPIHDEATCHVCETITAKRAEEK